MAQVQFDFKNFKIVIPCRIDETMETIIQRFLIKCEIKSSDNLFFLCNGRIVDKKLSFKEVANGMDNDRNQINIIVNEKQTEQKNVSVLKKSKHVICPQCNENIFMSIKDYTISLEECKNGHKINNILLSEFEKTQYLDYSSIKCNSCKEIKKSETFDNKFYICCECQNFLCPLCKKAHKQEHHIFDYDQKNFICRKHYESYISYCSDCKNDICLLCIKEHNGHKLINYGDIMPNINASEEELNKLKKAINEFKCYINELILKFNKLMENLDNYFNIYNNIINNFDVKYRNYYTITNLNFLNNYNDGFINILSTIINNQNIKNKLNIIMNIYDKMTFKEEKNENEDLDKEKREEIIQKNKKPTISFTTDYKIIYLFELNDSRILIYQEYFGEEHEKYKACVYNINNDVVTCDINSDIDEAFHKINIIKMSDNNIIKVNGNTIKVIKIKKHSFENVQIIQKGKYSFEKIYKLSNKKILIRDNYNKFFEIYFYQNGQLLLDTKKQIEFKEFISSLCPINEKEIIIFYDKDTKVFGRKAFIMFYDIINQKEIKLLKIGDYRYTSSRERMCLINNYLVVCKGANFDTLMIIDIKAKKILGEFKTKVKSSDGITLFKFGDNNICIIDENNMLYVYSINNLNNKIILNYNISYFTIYNHALK